MSNEKQGYTKPASFGLHHCRETKHEVQFADCDNPWKPQESKLVLLQNVWGSFRTEPESYEVFFM